MNEASPEYNHLIFNFPFSAKDEYCRELLEQHGLTRNASLADIEPLVKSLWERIPSRFEAMELVLGRNVASDELETHPLMGHIMLNDNPDKALFEMLLVRTAEERKPHTDE